MIVFHSDLDNTIIYSYKHDIGNAKRCVEIYQGREISFVTEKTHELLKQVREQVLFVPTTTRTVEQYERIDLGVGVPEYALACNGGVLLVDGQEDDVWCRESLERITDSRDELDRGARILEKDSSRTQEVRNIREMFLFTKCSRPREAVERLKQELNTELVDVFHNGVKVYVVPKKLSKGEAVRRFRERMRPDKVIAAGDSEFDLTMFEAADFSFAPAELGRENVLNESVICMDKDRIFSESVLSRILSRNNESE